jgi:hypothetical protein
MLKENQKEDFHIVTLPSSNLTTLLNFVTAVNTSIGHLDPLHLIGGHYCIQIRIRLPTS